MDKVLKFIKKQYFLLLAIIVWILGFCFLTNKNLDYVAGWLFFIAIIMTVIFFVRLKKKKPAPITNENYNRVELPERLSVNGRSFELKYDYSGVEIVGREHYSNIELFPGEAIKLLPEPTNQYDPGAVSVNVDRYGVNAVAGYIARDNRIKEMVNDFAKRGEPVVAYVDDAYLSTMVIGFYK